MRRNFSENMCRNGHLPLSRAAGFTMHLVIGYWLTKTSVEVGMNGARWKSCKLTVFSLVKSPFLDHAPCINGNLWLIFQKPIQVDSVSLSSPCFYRGKSFREYFILSRSSWNLEQKVKYGPHEILRCSGPLAISRSQVWQGELFLGGDSKSLLPWAHRPHHVSASEVSLKYTESTVHVLRTKQNTWAPWHFWNCTPSASWYSVYLTNDVFIEILEPSETYCIPRDSANVYRTWWFKKLQMQIRLMKDNWICLIYVSC